MARLVLIEENSDAVSRVVRELARTGAHIPVDAVSEAALTDAEAGAYVERDRRVLEWQQRAINSSVRSSSHIEYLKQFMWSRVLTENAIRHDDVP